MSELAIKDEDFGREKKDSRKQHSQIILDSEFAKWRKSDATKTMMIERLVGLAVLPVVFAWTGLTLVIGLGMAMVGAVLRAVGATFTSKP